MFSLEVTAYSLSLVDTEYSGNFAAMSFVCKFKRAQTLHCSLTIYSF
jgi:hypothetical protein